MCAPSPAVRPSAGGVPRRAATAAPSDASERASSGKKRPRVGVAPARDSSSARLTKMTRNRNSVLNTAGMEVLTACGEMSSQELLQKRLECELGALRGLLKKAELISRGGGACKGGAPAAGKKDRFLASNQRPKPIEEDFNSPAVKKRKISTLVEKKQKEIHAPRMSPEERNHLARRLSTLPGELAGHIVEFLQKQFGDPDTNGGIEINIDSVEDSVLFELKTLLDKLAEESKDNKLAEESNGDKLAEESKGEVVLERADRPAQVRPEQTIATSAQPPSEPAQAVQQSTEAKKVQDARRAAPKAVCMPTLLYRANLRRQMLEMERAALPDETIHRRDLQHLGIVEYGHPSLMRQLGLVLKANA